MATITAPNPDAIAGTTSNSTITVTKRGSVYLKQRTLVYTRKRRPYWVIDLYAINNTMRILPEDDA